MKVCIYGAASDKIDDIYKEDCFVLGKTLGERGHDLVFGAGSSGLMGASARGFKSAGAHVFGVIPRFFEDNGYEAIYHDADDLIYTETMEERKAIMENECDAFIIVPGGIGTLDEFFQIITLKQLGRLKKTIAVYNCNGFYDSLQKMFDDMIEKGFVNKECTKLFKVFDNKEEVVNYVENNDDKDVDWALLKRNEE